MRTGYAVVAFIGILLFGVCGISAAEETAVIVDANGDGAPDTVLASPEQDITQFQAARGYDENMRPVAKDGDDLPPAQCKKELAGND